MFKIIDIQVNRKESNWFLIDIKFIADKQNGTLGYLEKYFPVNVVEDIEAYEKYYDDPENLDYDLEQVADSNTFQMKFKKPSPWEIGLCKRTNAIGRDCIYTDDEGYQHYKQYISSNYITEAAVKQLYEMKEHMEKGYCRWGNYPEQVGSFRSGDPFHDFVGILEVLDRFWD